jgi:hypothetical protein
VAARGDTSALYIGLKPLPSSTPLQRQFGEAIDDAVADGYRSIITARCRLDTEQISVVLEKYISTNFIGIFL